MTKYLNYYDSPVGQLALVEEDAHLTMLGLVGDDLPDDAVICGHDTSDNPCIDTRGSDGALTPLLAQVRQQLNEYFAGTRQIFDLPLKPAGTDFQQAVWAALCDVPFGQTASYGQIAAVVGKPKAARAVGGANNRNPIAIVIPCHRIVGASGAMVGYRGGLDIKEYLLRHEGII